MMREKPLELAKVEQNVAGGFEVDDYAYAYCGISSYHRGCPG